ncbi:hypothetical protein [Clostridium sp. ATCC 25772]|uniref:hypothetical protein n=1 Tax=Clostridium sp. ATCC 25772 TaxID=1676991 RepID=UPI00078635D1|nr:hypothetical protein [Clostridium sp. ATCC 25772]
MKKFKSLILASAAIALFTFTGCSSNGEATKNEDAVKTVAPMEASFDVQDYDGTKFTASIPANWKVDETIAAPLVAFLNVDEASDAFTPNCNINILDVPKGALDNTDMDEYIKTIKEGFESQPKSGFTVTNSEVIDLPTGKGALIELDCNVSAESFEALEASGMVDKSLLEKFKTNGSLDELNEALSSKQIQIHIPQGDKIAIMAYSFNTDSTANNKELSTYIAHHIKVK